MVPSAMKLSALKSNSELFSILELDQAPYLAQQLGLDLKVKGGLEQLQLVLQALITHLAPLPSAVIAEPVYSFPLLMDDLEQGLILRLEKVFSEPQPQTQAVTPRLANNWGVNEVANNYAVAKLGLWYHPAEENALAKKKLVAEIYHYCQQLGIDLLLKLKISRQPDESRDKIVFQEAQLQAIQELRAVANLLVLQYPGDAVATATITAELDQPWLIYLDEARAKDYQAAKQELRIALENGAQGFVAGQILWSELGQLRQEDQTPDLSAIQKLIETQGRDRLLELVRISNEAQS